MTVSSRILLLDSRRIRLLGFGVELAVVLGAAGVQGIGANLFGGRTRTRGRVGVRDCPARDNHRAYDDEQDHDPGNYPPTPRTGAPRCGWCHVLLLTRTRLRLAVSQAAALRPSSVADTSVRVILRPPDRTFY